MSVRMKEHPTETVCTLTFVGPVKQVEAARDALHALGFQEARDAVPWREAFPACSDPQLPVLRMLEHGQKKGSLRSSLPR